MATNFIHWVDNEAHKLANSITVQSNDIITNINTWLILFMFVGIIVLGYMILAGYARDSLRRFIGFFFKFIIISAILTSFQHYDSTVGQSVREIPTVLIDTVNCDKATNNTCTNENKYSRKSLMGKNNFLDKQFSAFFVITKSAWSKANSLGNNFGMWILALSLIIFSTLFTITAGFVLITTFIISKILIIFGPIFIAAMLFRATQTFFTTWMGLIIKLILIEVFTVITAVFIYDQLERLIVALGFDNFAKINANHGNDANSAIQALYQHITLGNIVMICSIFFLGILIIRLMITVADELSKGLKMVGRLAVESADRFVSGNSQTSYNTAHFNNPQSSYMSLFRQNQTNQYKQNYSQTMAQNLNTNSRTSHAGYSQTNQRVTSNRSINNKSSNTYKNQQRYSSNRLAQRKMAYQKRFRGSP